MLSSRRPGIAVGKALRLRISYFTGHLGEEETLGLAVTELGMNSLGSIVLTLDGGGHIRVRLPPRSPLEGNLNTLGPQAASGQSRLESRKPLLGNSPDSLRFCAKCVTCFWNQAIRSKVVCNS